MTNIFSLPSDSTPVYLGSFRTTDTTRGTIHRRMWSHPLAPRILLEQGRTREGSAWKSCTVIPREDLRVPLWWCGMHVNSSCRVDLWTSLVGDPDDWFPLYSRALLLSRNLVRPSTFGPDATVPNHIHVRARGSGPVRDWKKYTMALHRDYWNTLYRTFPSYGRRYSKALDANDILPLYLKLGEESEARDASRFWHTF